MSLYASCSMKCAVSGPGLGLPRTGPPLLVDAVDQDRQQLTVVGVLEVEWPFPAFDVEIHGRVEPLAPRPWVDAAAGLVGGEAGRIILRSVEQRLVDRLWILARLANTA